MPASNVLFCGSRFWLMFFPQAGQGNKGEQDGPHCYGGVSDVKSRPEYITPEPDIDKIRYAAEPQPVYEIAQRPGKNQAQRQATQKTEVAADT